ncbi:hypothetical protein [Sphaerisporangium aureirubrum]|uniref:Uncharacterized protein n=1 Tax=Sphaerisporangium aureirubrum TaxID=1544736 RepID=A0ABW1NRG2_9ACTN
MSRPDDQTHLGTWPPRPVKLASYAGARFGDIREMCSPTVSRSEQIAYVALYSKGSCVFDVDAYGDPASEHEARRAAFRNAGCHVVAQMKAYDGALAELDTGELMRTVLEEKRLVIFCGRVRRDQHLVGIMVKARRDLGAEACARAVDTADREFFSLVTAIRQAYHLPDEMAGGRTGSGQKAVTGRSHAHLSQGGEATGRENELCRQAATLLAPDDLHYLALYRDWRLLFAADILDASSLALFADVEPEERRRMYDRQARAARHETLRLAHKLRPVMGRRFDRIVLDMQQGALYYHWPTPEHLVFGVTLWQRAVNDAEWRLREVVDTVRRGLSLPS